MVIYMDFVQKILGYSSISRNIPQILQSSKIPEKDLGISKDILDFQGHSRQSEDNLKNLRIV